MHGHGHGQENGKKEGSSEEEAFLMSTSTTWELDGWNVLCLLYPG